MAERVEETNQIPKPKELYYQYSKQQQRIEKYHETIMEKYKEQEIFIEEQKQKLEEITNELQEEQVKCQDLEDELTTIRMKNEQEGRDYQERIQRWIDVAERLEKQAKEFREKQEKKQEKKHKIEEMIQTQKEAIKKFDQIQQIDKVDFQMNAYDIDQTQTQRFNRRRYFAKWLDDNKVIGKKETIERWKKMRNKYWNIHCLGKSDLQKDIIINKRGWISFSDEFKKCYKSCIILEWNGWTFAIKVRKINFINKKYIKNLKEINSQTSSQGEQQEVEDFDEIYF